MAFPRPETVKKVQSFLQNHWLVQSLVRIPIQLDALCYIWSGLDQDIPQTITAFYQGIEQKLLEKKHNGELVTASHVQNSYRSEIEGLVKDEICFLEGLAFTGLHNDVIDFESRHLRVVSEHFKDATAFLLSKTPPRLSFLRT